MFCTTLCILKPQTLQIRIPYVPKHHISVVRGNSSKSYIIMDAIFFMCAPLYFILCRDIGYTAGFELFLRISFDFTAHRDVQHVIEFFATYLTFTQYEPLNQAALFLCVVYLALKFD